MSSPLADQMARLRPYAPGAIAVLRYLAEDPGRVDEPADRLAAASGTTIASVSAVVAALRAGLGGEAGGEARHLGADVLEDLASRLDGFAEGYEWRRTIEPEIVPIFTIPVGSRLEAELEVSPTSALSYETRDGFRHVAHRAERRLAILMPFLDSLGVEYLIGLAGQTRAKEKTIILRPRNKAAERPWLRFCPAMRAAGLDVLEYWVEPVASMDLGPMSAETSHAKIAIADEALAYFGSSNLQSSSLDFGLECGAILTGRAAAPFVRVVEAVRRLARPVAI